MGASGDASSSFFGPVSSVPTDMPQLVMHVDLNPAMTAVQHHLPTDRSRHVLPRR